MQTNRGAEYRQWDGHSPNTAQEVGSWSQRTHFIDHYWAACALDHSAGYLASQETVKHWQSPQCDACQIQGVQVLPDGGLCLDGTQEHQQCFHTRLQPPASLAVQHNEVWSQVCSHRKIIGFPLLCFPLNAGLDSPAGPAQIKPLLVHKKVYGLHGQKIRDGGEWLSSSWLWVDAYKAIWKTDVW